MAAFQFNAVLLEISDALSADELSKMKYLCAAMIGKRELETMDSGRKLFQTLSERGLLGIDRRDRLSGLLTGIRRQDLSDKLGFEIVSENEQPDERERARLAVATELIAENLGRNWRRLGRKLGLSEVRLESVSSRHPTDLEETAVELLKEWRKVRGAQAQTEELIKALRGCKYNRTADEVEDKLASLQT
ncbi:FAS-associated death domain protein [Brachionichthys hirsutus]|uniref:FAS-associated death domain protein n=1 Tax=Brachionichthys hirsutus TaxID=412623 RepID=UPI003604DD3A